MLQEQLGVVIRAPRRVSPVNEEEQTLQRLRDLAQAIAIRQVSKTRVRAAAELVLSANHGQHEQRERKRFLLRSTG